MLPLIDSSCHILLYREDSIFLIIRDEAGCTFKLYSFILDCDGLCRLVLSRRQIELPRITHFDFLCDRDVGQVKARLGPKYVKGYWWRRSYFQRDLGQDKDTVKIVLQGVLKRNVDVANELRVT